MGRLSCLEKFKVLSYNAGCATRRIIPKAIFRLGRIPPGGPEPPRVALPNKPKKERR